MACTDTADKYAVCQRSVVTRRRRRRAATYRDGAHRELFSSRCRNYASSIMSSHACEEASRRRHDDSLNERHYGKKEKRAHIHFFLSSCCAIARALVLSMTPRSDIKRVFRSAQSTGLPRVVLFIPSCAVMVITGHIISYRSFFFSY